MIDSLSSKVARLLSLGIKSLVDNAEDAQPQATSDQAIQDIDQLIAEIKADLGQVIASQHLSNKRLTHEKQKHQQLSESIERALSQGQDKEAEAGIAQQLDIEAQLPVLEQAVNEASSQLKQLEHYIEALKARKREVHSELADLGASQQASSLDTRINKADQIQSRFDESMKQYTGIVSDKPDIHMAAQLAELEEITRERQIKERLAKLKGDH